MAYRGIVKWHNDGLQNRSWEFDSLCPCKLKSADGIAGNSMIMSAMCIHKLERLERDV